MSTSLHTPGPWDFNSSDECLIRIAAFPGNHHIAEVQPMDGGEHKANARLIAAAPELLAALILAAKELDINNPDPDLFDESETAGIIRAAIAKATP